ncbi:MAG: hypothetical protein HY331_10005 [Chloroflexi bacterium]|nr:hypothetical protein [Chloroflexota bacterium]
MASVRTHVVVSAVLGVVAGLTSRSMRPLLGVVAAGVLIDVDHIVDYAWCRRRARRDRVVLPLHGWELAAGLACWAARRPDPLRLAIAVSYAVHLVLDLLANSPASGLSYSLLYRAAGVFSHRRFCRPGNEPHQWMKTGLLRFDAPSGSAGVSPARFSNG